MGEQIHENLYQFTALAGQMNLPVHQYLLATEPSIMIATGSHSQASWILPQIDEILEGRPLDYLFISHMESDEAGGIGLFLKKYPKMNIICSGFTANEIKGYGFKAKIMVGEEGNGFKHGNLAFKFFKYPAEVHLHDGLLLLEQNNGIFYSSDLMAHRVTHGANIVDGIWQKEVESIDSTRIADDSRREKLKSQLMQVKPSFIAVGHGSCVRIM